MTSETHARKAIIDACLKMNTTGLNQGTSGNISVRFGDRMLISPSATPYDQLRPEMIASIELQEEMTDAMGRSAQAISRMAVPLAVDEKPARPDRDRSRPPSLLHGACRLTRANPSMPLYDRGLWRD